MNPSTISRCIKEAERFVKLAKAVPIEHVPAHESEFAGHHVKAYDRVEAGKASAAAKRASMDLSRALADLRQGR